MVEYHERWIANKELAEEFGYNAGESGRATNRECEAGGIKILDSDYDKKFAESREVAGGGFLAATFLPGADRRQYRGGEKGQKTYPETVQKAQDLLKEWEGEKAPVHGSYEGMSFANVVNNDDRYRGAANEGDAQASDRRASRDGATKTCRY